MNTAAVKAWEQKKSPSLQSIRSKRQRRRRRRPGAKSCCTTSDVAVETQRPRSQHISETYSHKTNSSDFPNDNGSISRSPVPVSVLSSFRPTKITVQISQRSNLDRELYIAYQSSLSTQETPPFLSNSSSGTEGFTAPPAASLATDSNGIVPDSQSLPGSSSYQPTPSTSLAVLGVDQAPLTQQSFVLHNNTDTESSTGEVAEVNDSIEEFSVAAVASQPSLIPSERYKSEPAPSTTESSSASSFGARFPSLPRSTSDPTSAYDDQRRRRAFVFHDLGHSHIIRDNLFQIPLDSQSSHETRAGKTQQRQRPSEIQVPGSSDRSSHQSHKVADSAAHSPVFLTQAPLAFASQGSRVSITSAGTSCSNPELPQQFRVRIYDPLTCDAEYQSQNAQLNPQSAGKISGTSSESIGKPTHRIDPQPIISTALSEADEHRSPHPPTAPRIFAIAEDSTDNSHPSQATTTDESILSVRDPNSQSSRQNHLSFPKESSTHLGDPIEIFTRTDSSSILASRVQLPDSLDSREPPKPPPSLEDAMSDITSNDNGLPEGTQPLRIRATLKRIREDGEAKRVAARSGKRQHSEPSTSRASPLLTQDHREGSQTTTSLGLSPMVADQAERSQVSTAGGSPAPSGDDQQRVTPVVAGASPSQTGEERRVRVPTVRQSLRSTASPSIIPAKAPYQVQEEPERLEIQPSMILKEISMPARNPHSAPHTPTTPSKLSMHKEASPMRSQTTTLKVRNLGPREFVVTLPMQPRILSQYVDTIEYYPQAINRNMTEEIIGEEVVERLNTLLCRLGNVATHIGLEGGGPSSQEEINPEEEALYAELSSEKFKFLGHLLALTKESQIHIAVVAKPGHLLDVIEMFLKGKHVSYERPDTMTNGLKAPGAQAVSLIPSEGTICFPPAQLIIAFDETFDATSKHIINSRESTASDGGLIPVIRLIVYNSVEHLDLCLARSLEPINRIRKLIFCVWHTQRSVGQLEPNEPDSAACAQEVFGFFRSGSKTSAWTLASIRPIENLPVMDSDSSLSDALSDISDICKPEGAPKYYPNPVLPLVTNPNRPDALPRGRRPFVSAPFLKQGGFAQLADSLQDLEYGDSLEVQAKKRKMLADYDAGRLNAPVSIQHNSAFPGSLTLDSPPSKALRPISMNARSPKSFGPTKRSK